jgi:hypothetical protein
VPAQEHRPTPAAKLGPRLIDPRQRSPSAGRERQQLPVAEQAVADVDRAGAGRRTLHRRNICGDLAERRRREVAAVDVQRVALRDRDRDRHRLATGTPPSAIGRVLQFTNR